MLTSQDVAPPYTLMAFVSTIMRPWRKTLVSRLLAALLFVTCLASFSSQAQTLALTFDDGFNATDAHAADDNAAMIAALKHHAIHAMLFPTGLVANTPENMALIRAWAAAGHGIGNHTYSHDALGKTDTTQFFDDVLHAESLLHKLRGWCPRLRFPYLDEGSSDLQFHLTMQWMAEHGYGIAPATISIADWESDQHYQQLLANGTPAQVAAFQQAYLEQLWSQAQAQQTHWYAMLGRDPAHVLLLHTTRLNAAILPDLLDLLKRKGWTFIDAATAFQDPIYQRRYSQANSAPALLPSPTCH